MTINLSELLNNTYSGYTGSKGDTGFTGSQGDLGYTGSQGFTGSQGERGFTGSQGDTGFVGSRGNTGFTGSQGIQGDIGFTGSQGIQGDTGFTGSQGATGFTGSVGFVGSRGNTGFTGSVGFVGSIGFTGSQGPSTLINATNDTTTVTLYPVMIGAAGSNQTPKTTTTKLYFDAATGTLSATELNSLSDITLKKDIKPIDDALSVINSIDGIEFNWIDNNKKSYGVMAQQIESIIPDLVSNHHHKTVNYSGIIAFLIQAIKQLNDKIERNSK